MSLPKKGFLIATLLLISGVLVVPAWGEEGVVEGEPLPNFVRNKHVLPPILLKDKREGRYMVGMPIIGWDPDEGASLGAAVVFFDNGSKDNPFFRISPYRQMIAAQALVTTRGILRVKAAYDQPYILDTPFRPRAEVEFDYNPVRNYFGIGDNSLNLLFPGTGQVFTNYTKYKDALDLITNGTTNARYDEYKFTRAVLRGSVEYDLLGGYVRVLGGFQASRVWLNDYTGDTVNGRTASGQKAKATQNSTHLNTDCTSGAAKGCNGGFDNYLKVGAIFDTRNFEPDPQYGFVAETVGEFSTKVWGSAFNYGRWTTNFRGYGNLMPNNHKRPLVVATRFLFNWQFGNIPVYSMNGIALTGFDVTGLGGFRTLRGYRLDRFIGPVSMMGNMEVRWTFARAQLFKQNLKFTAAPFFDAGRPFSSIGNLSFANWKVDGGIGLRLAWNLSTIISFDYAVASEGSALYMEIDHSF